MRLVKHEKRQSLGIMDPIRSSYEADFEEKKEAATAVFKKYEELTQYND